MTQIPHKRLNDFLYFYVNSKHGRNFRRFLPVGPIATFMGSLMRNHLQLMSFFILFRFVCFLFRQIKRILGAGKVTDLNFAPVVILHIP